MSISAKHKKQQNNDGMDRISEINICSNFLFYFYLYMKAKHSFIEKRVGGYSYSESFPLGKGATGNVYRGKRRSDQMPVAVKVINEHFLTTEVTRYLLHNEIDACIKLVHHNIVRTYDVVRQNGYCYIFMELCSGGNLRQLIKRKGKFSQKEALDIFEKILNGYAAIAKARILHRDLKNENILLREDSSPVIIDLGYSEFIDYPFKPKTSYNVGSPAYMSPEAYNHNQYSVKSDIWSLGIMLYQMLNGTIPILKVKQPDRYFKTLEHLKYPADLNMKYENQITRQIILRTLTVSVQDRASVEELKNMFLRWKKQKQITSPEKKYHHRMNSMTQITLPSSERKKNLHFNRSSSKHSSDMFSPLKTILPQKEEREKQFGKLKRKIIQGGNNIKMKPIRVHQTFLHDKQIKKQHSDFSPHYIPRRVLEHASKSPPTKTTLNRNSSMGAIPSLNIKLRMI